MKVDQITEQLLGEILQDFDQDAAVRLEVEDNFTEDMANGDKVMLKREWGSFLIDVKSAGCERARITVDSRAEESACPKEWDERCGLSETARNKCS